LRTVSGCASEAAAGLDCGLENPIIFYVWTDSAAPALIQRKSWRDYRANSRIARSIPSQVSGYKSARP